MTIRNDKKQAINIITRIELIDILKMKKEISNGSKTNPGILKIPNNAFIFPASPVLASSIAILLKEFIKQPKPNPVKKKIK